tara:strand:- start:174 stop:380 length:207 start_codon:yes stop_codon:yes gene_type:complete
MSEWISVDDGLPSDMFDWVLVFSDGDMGLKGYTKDKGFYDPYPSVSNLSGYSEITHWMPLPEPPKGGE